MSKVLKKHNSQPSFLAYNNDSGVYVGSRGLSRFCYLQYNNDNKRGYDSKCESIYT